MNILMKTGAIDKQINNYLEFLTTKQKEAVLTVMKTFAEEQEGYNHWEDETFVIGHNGQKWCLKSLKS